MGLRVNMLSLHLVDLQRKMMRCTQFNIDPCKSEIKSYFQIVMIASNDLISDCFAASQKIAVNAWGKQKPWSCTS
jgi:hypothetical protein